MKILQIIYNLASGGAERFVVDLCNQLAKNGNEVYLCALCDDRIDNQGFYKKDIEENVNYINLQMPKGFRLLNIKIIYDQIRIIRPEVVHCHQNLVNYVFPITLFKSKIKFFYTVHNDASKEVSNKLEYFIRCYFFKKRVTVITISTETTKSFVQYYKISNYFEIVNGRNTPKVSLEILKVTEFVNKLREIYDFVFLHIGRCSIQKNQEMLINVINRLSNEGHKIVLLIIGGKFEIELGKKLRAMENEHILFIGEKNNIADYLINADAFCLSSIYEGMPITLIESLACGCVPICTPVGGIVNTITNGVTGYISNSVSEEDYYQSVKEYLYNSTLVQKDNLIHCFNENFTIENCAERHLRLYLKAK